MALITLLIVLAIEFYLKQGSELRDFTWFKKLQKSCQNLLGDNDFFDGGGGVAVILLIPVIGLHILLNILPTPLETLGVFLISVAVLFYCLGPKPLFDSFSHYFQAMERGDVEAAFLSLQKESLADDLPEGDQLVRNTTRSILVESQIRYFGVIFWFIFIGPVGALLYRLAHEYSTACEEEKNESHMEVLDSLIHILDWLPARLTSLFFLVTGDFMNGFYRLKDYIFDFNANNRHLICEVGIAALNLDMHSDEDDYKENRQVFSMINRTIIIYLIATILLSQFAMW